MAPNTAAADETAGNAGTGAQAPAQGVTMGSGPHASGAELAVRAAVAGPAPGGKKAP